VAVTTVTRPKVTPGPWRADGGVVELRHGDDMSRMIVPGRSLNEGEANAHLIAAAPEMYEALRVLVEYFEEGKHSVLDYESFIARARTAIAKAEGR